MTDINVRNDAQTNQEFQQREILPNERERRVRVRTFVVPLLFMLIHTGAMIAAMFARFLVHILSVDRATAEILLGKLKDPAFYSEFMIEINMQTFASFFSMLLLIPIYLFYVYWRKRKNIQVLDLSRISFAQVVNAFAIVLGSIGLTQIWMAVLSQLDPSSALGIQFQRYIDLMKHFEPSEGWMMVLEIATTVILVPIGEELLFRGIIQDEMRRAFPPAFAVVATSLVFAIFHGNFIQGSYVFFVGLALSLAYHLTNNFYIPIGMHIVFNLVGSGAFSRLVGLTERGETILMYVLYASIPLMIIGFFCLRYLRNKRSEVQYE